MVNSFVNLFLKILDKYSCTKEEVENLLHFMILNIKPCDNSLLVFTTINEMKFWTYLVVKHANQQATQYDKER